MKLKTFIISTALFFSINVYASCGSAQNSYLSALSNLTSVLSNPNSTSAQVNMAQSNAYAAQVNVELQCHQF